MKKTLLAILASASLFAADHNLYNHSLFLVGGYAVNSSQSNLDNATSWGLRYNYNRSTIEGSIDIDAIQFAFDYSGDTTYQNPSEGIVDGETSIFRLGANALWYIENDSDFTPFVLLGIGVQGFGEDEAEDTNNIFFGTVGAGVEYQLRGDFSVVAEAKSMFAGDDSTYFMTNVGFKYSFGQSYGNTQTPAMQMPAGQVPVGTVIRY